MSKPNEHRKHVRIYRNFILSYHPLSNPLQQKSVSQINNISAGGMNFSVSEPLQAGEMVEIELKTPFIADNLCLQGAVLECREKISDLIYEVRVQFKDIPAHAKEILAKVEQYAKES